MFPLNPVPYWVVIESIITLLSFCKSTIAVLYKNSWSFFAEKMFENQFPVYENSTFLSICTRTRRTFSNSTCFTIRFNSSKILVYIHLLSPLCFEYALDLQCLFLRLNNFRRVSNQSVSDQSGLPADFTRMSQISWKIFVKLKPTTGFYIKISGDSNNYEKILTFLF